MHVPLVDNKSTYIGAKIAPTIEEVSLDKEKTFIKTNSSKNNEFQNDTNFFFINFKFASGSKN